MAFAAEQHAEMAETETATSAGYRPVTEPARSDIFARISQGKNVKVRPLADAIGMSVGGLYQAIERKDVKAVTVGRAVLVPAHEAKRLLGWKNAA